MNIKRDFPQLDMLLSRSSLTASRYCIAHLTFILFDDEKNQPYNTLLIWRCSRTIKRKTNEKKLKSWLIASVS